VIEAGGVAPVEDVGRLAFREPPEQAADAVPPAPEPAPALAVQRAKPTRLAKQERRLLDLLEKKQDVAVVPVDDEGRAPSSRSALDPAAAGKVILGTRRAFDACISRALRLHPDLKLAPRATLVVTVQPSGAVRRAWLAEEEVDRTELGACLAETARRMVFPAFDGEPVDVAMPLSLSAVL
jgi:hypothetical protein